eukprot:scaffold3151_cov110-Cylindrotheca_fusiformis.AAC.1
MSRSTAPALFIASRSSRDSAGEIIGASAPVTLAKLIPVDASSELENDSRLWSITDCTSDCLAGTGSLHECSELKMNVL